MCMQCHKMYNNDVQILINELKEIKLKPEFERWNTTSVGHLLISGSGKDGEEAKVLSIEILEMFLQWYEENKDDCYYPEYGLENMTSKEQIKTYINQLKDGSFQIKDTIDNDESDGYNSDY